MSDVYIWHHNDLDGITSAAFIYDFLRSKRGTSNGIISNSVSHAISKDVWYSTKLPYPSIVLDYKFNPTAAIWIDHHKGQQQYVNPPRFVCDENSPSCCRLVWNWLFENFGYRNDKWVDTVYWMDIIDSANYVSPTQYIECKEPALKVNLAVYEKNDDPDFVKRVLHLFLEKFTFEHILDDPQIFLLYKEARKKQILAITVAKKKSKLFKLPNGLIVHVLDIFNEDKSGKVSYFNIIAFFLYPKADVSITINDYSGNGKPTVGLSVNPFKNIKYDVDVSKIAKKHGGGGHLKAAGFQSNMKTLQKHLKDVLSDLSNIQPK